MKCPICETSCEKMAHFPSAFFANSKGKMHLQVSFCPSCGYCFQGSAYTEEYDQLVEQVYRDYNVNEGFMFPERSPKNLIALEMLDQHSLFNNQPNILEIGSNRGDLLHLIKEKYPHTNVLGLEPTISNDLSVPTINAKFRKDLFSNKFDIIIIKHVLEHIKFPQNFLIELREILKPSGYLYIEVPDLERSLKFYIDDFIPDHVSFFSESSLLKLLSQIGFKVVTSQRKNFLHMILQIGEKTEKGEDVEDLEKKRNQFADFLKKRTSLLKEIQAKDKLLFYGVSYYFRRIFEELKVITAEKDCFFWDDNFEGYKEPFSNLDRRQAQDDLDLIIICTNNRSVQEKILKKIRLDGIQTPVLMPWSQIDVPA